MVSSTDKLTVEEFFELPEGDRNYELIDGRAIAKMSPKYLSFSNSKNPAVNVRKLGEKQRSNRARMGNQTGKKWC